MMTGHHQRSRTMQVLNSLQYLIDLLMSLQFLDGSGAVDAGRFAAHNSGNIGGIRGSYGSSG